MQKLEFASLFILSVLVFFSSCTYDKLEEENLCEEVISIELIENIGTDCGTDNGSLEVLATSPSNDKLFQYSINGQSFTDGNTFDNLSAGNYTITAQTAEGCQAEATFQIENKSGLTISVTTTDSDCDTPNGSISIQASDFSGNVTYQINDEAVQSEAEFSNLGPGAYSVKVRDDANCEVVQQIEIASKLTVENIHEILLSNCASSSCHGGSITPDFREQSNVVDFRGRIQARTSARTMPPANSGITLDQQIIDDIACWVENF